ncbi:MAG: DUF4405 domain-containing protein [Phycisphaerae bacterium]
MLRRSSLNFLVDSLALLAIFVMIATGLVIRFALPPGTGGRHGKGGLELWGLGRHDWGDVHFWTSVVLGVLLIVHVALHWSWVCMTVKRMLGGTESDQPRAGRCNACGIVFLLAVLLAFLGFTWYARGAVKKVNPNGDAETRPWRLRDDAGRHGQWIEHDLGQISGSMSLGEIETATGVPADTLKSELGLPADISDQQRIGRLSRQYGFSMDKVRHVIANQTSRSAE